MIDTSFMALVYCDGDQAGKQWLDGDPASGWVSLSYGFSSAAQPGHTGTLWQFDRMAPNTYTLKNKGAGTALPKRFLWAADVNKDVILAPESTDDNVQWIFKQDVEDPVSGMMMYQILSKQSEFGDLYLTGDTRGESGGVSLTDGKQGGNLTGLNWIVLVQATFS
ncbi:MAG TPA: hypothetical protein VJU86_11805 [Pyrinomonadaceae bacterium]|nr:hypothetical protein [Pyrinomonadaceae bacterium]